MFTNGYYGTNSVTEAILQLGAPIKGGFTLNISGLQSFSGVPTSNSSIAASIDPLTSEDIALGGIQVPGATLYRGPGSYTVNAAGFDIWNAEDSFRFVYEPKTNSFDVEVEVTSVSPVNQYTKAGLMVREAIDPLDGGSRMLAHITFADRPPVSPPPLDGSTSQNTVEDDLRDGPDIAAYNGNSGVHTNFNNDTLTPSLPTQWLRLARDYSVGGGVTNDLFTTYASTNGSDWTMVSTYNPAGTPTDAGLSAPFPSVVYVGMCTTAHETAAQTFLTTVTYENFGDTAQIVVPNRPTLKATLASKTTVSVSWTPPGGTLYSSSVLSTNSASWSVVGTNNPSVVNITGGAQYFEIRQ